MRAITAMLILAACYAPATQTTTTPVEPRRPPIGFSNWACGDTYRWTEPAAYVRVDLPIDTAHIPGLIAHEIDHDRTASLFPTCEHYHKWLRTPGNREQTEVWAYCAQIRVDVARGRYALAEALEQYAWILSTEYSFGLTPLEAEAALAHECAGGQQTSKSQR